MFFRVGARLSPEHLVGQFFLPAQTIITIAIGALPIRVRELIILPDVVAIFIKSGPHLPCFGQLLFAKGGLHLLNVRIRAVLLLRNSFRFLSRPSARKKVSAGFSVLVGFWEVGIVVSV